VLNFQREYLVVFQNTNIHITSSIRGVFMNIKSISSLLVGIAGILATSAQAQVPPYVTIPPFVNGVQNPSYGGTGCPAGTARAVVSPDRQAFTMIFDQYYVNAPSPGSLDRKNCQILVNFDFPQGWSYSIVRLDYRGFVDLGPGASGFQQSLYYFQGQPQQGRLRTNFYGPRSGDYTISDTLGISDVVWSPCGARRGLNINSSLFASAGRGFANSYAYLTNDSIDGTVKTTYILQWRRCF
jgi:hypothetical protein